MGSSGYVRDSIRKRSDAYFSSSSVLKDLARKALETLPAADPQSTDPERYGAPWWDTGASIPQRRFAALYCQEALYGGATRGGKTATLVHLALRECHHPTFVGLIIRETFRDLNAPTGPVDLSKQWLAGTGAKYHRGDAIWTFPSGARLAFGHLSDPDSYRHYQGSGYSYLAFDELTHIREFDYRWLFNRLSKEPGAPFVSRVRSSANPGGKGHDWVKARFIDPRTREPGAEFVPALLTDNPGIDHDDYRRQLAKLPPVLRKQLEEGDWDARSDGALFQRAWFNYVDAAPAAALENSVRFWDCAATEEQPHRDPDATAGVRIGEAAGKWYIIDVRHGRWSPGTVETQVASTAEQDSRLVPVRMEQEPGSSGVAVIARYRDSVLVGYDFRGVRSTGSKVHRAGPLASAAEAGNLYLVRAPWNAGLVDEFCGFPFGAHDDRVDATSGGMGEATSGGRLTGIEIGPAKTVGVRGALGMNGGVRSHLR